jgi:hypothetical protein
MQVLITALSLCMRTEEEPAQHASAHHGALPMHAHGGGACPACKC